MIGLANIPVSSPRKLGTLATLAFENVRQIGASSGKSGIETEPVVNLPAISGDDVGAAGNLILDCGVQDNLNALVFPTLGK